MPNYTLENERQAKSRSARLNDRPGASTPEAGPAPTASLAEVQRAMQQPDRASPQVVRQMQHTYGNQFVQRWLQQSYPAPEAVSGDRASGVGAVIQRTPDTALSTPGPRTTEGVIQRAGEYGPLPTEPKARRKEIARRIRARRDREHNEKYGWFGSKTFLGKAAGWFSYGSHEAEDEHEYFDSGEGLQEVEDDFEEEEESESILSLNKIEINLKEGEFERGPVRGKGELKGGLEGLKAEGQLAYDGGTSTTSTLGEREVSVRGRKFKGSGTRRRDTGLKAKAAGEISADTEKVEGKGEVNFVYGTADRMSGSLGWDMLGSQVEGVGSVTHFSGAKVGGKAKGSYDYKSGGFAAKGKASAFLGESVDVKVKVGSEDLGTFKGNMGVSYGVGGELAGSITWEGGTLTLAGKGKAAMGMGLSFGYKLELNTQSLGRRFWSWLSGWGSWAWDVLDAVDEPLMI